MPWPLDKFAAMRIGRKITLMYGGIFSIGLCAATIVIVVNVGLVYRRGSVNSLNRAAERVAAFIEDGGEITDANINAAKRDKSISMDIYSLDDFRSPVYSESPADSEVRANIGKPRIGKLTNIGGVPYMYGERNVFRDGREFSIRVYRNYEREQSALTVLGAVLGVFISLGVLVAFMTGRAISRMTLKPIVDLRKTAERISIEDLSRRISVDGPDDEIKELSITFNAMIDRLEAAFVKQNQFIADASHELRTPISVIQGYANLMNRWGKHDPAVEQESIDSIIAETEHMSALVKKLLFMARMDQGKMPERARALTLRQIAEDVIREAKVLETPGTILFTDDSADGGAINGDYDLLKQMMWIFLDNSVKYAGEEPLVVRIGLRGGNGDGCVVTMADNGKGISAEDLPRIFERFYRADKSRGGDAHGAGLGLSIAEWIIRRHGAKASVDSRPGQGTEFTITFGKVVGK